MTTLYLMGEIILTDRNFHIGFDTQEKRTTRAIRSISSSTNMDMVE